MFERSKFGQVGAVLTGALMLCALSVTSASAGAIIGNWNSSARSWNESNFTTIKATMTGAGHTVEADESITAGNLANNNMFVIGEATTVLTGAEATALSNWVSGGGILWLAIDSGTNATISNGILGNVGSTMSFGTTIGNFEAALVTDIFASDGPPYNIVGQSLAVSLQQGPVAGGTTLSGGMIHWEQIGAGYVFASGDRFEHDFFSPTAGTTNGKFFLNIANQAMASQSVPEPSTVAIFGLGLAGLGFMRRRRKLH